MNAVLVMLTVLSLAPFCGQAEAGDLPKAIVDSDYRQYSEAQIKLGRLLFYDRVLSGTYRVSCATCHNHDRGSSNGLRLDGAEPVAGDNLVINGSNEYEVLKPSSRHAPTLFNMGAKEFKTLFIDGRVARRDDGSFASPVGRDLPDGLQDVLAVQALFPAVTGGELVGTVDNEVKAAAHQGNDAIWKLLAKRVQELPEYQPHFQAAYGMTFAAKDITIVHIANAISAFVGTEWRSDNSPFDWYLRGETAALTDQQTRGMKLFYGDAGCDTCHAGPFQTDHKFHQADFPNHPFNKTDSAVDDSDASFEEEQGRFNVTGARADRKHFRTPSLRNVVKTAPHGHLGGFKTLRETMEYHYAKKSEKRDQEIDDLIAFLGSLTDEQGLAGRLGKPAEVPSSLVID